MALPQAIDIRISMLRLAPQCFAFTSIYTDRTSVKYMGPIYAVCKMDKMAALA